MFFFNFFITFMCVCMYVCLHTQQWAYGDENITWRSPFCLSAMESWETGFRFSCLYLLSLLTNHEHVLRRRNQLGQIPLINKMKTVLDTADHIAGIDDFYKHFWWRLILLRQKSWMLPLRPLFPPQKILRALCSDIPRSAHISLFPWWNVHSCSRFKERHYTVIADTQTLVSSQWRRMANHLRGELAKEIKSIKILTLITFRYNN